MPIYAAHCNQCGKDEDFYRTVANYKDIPFCCGEQMERRICAPQVIKDIDPYVSMIDGSVITSRSQHRDHLRQHGCTEVGNEKMSSRKESWIENKQNKDALRREISARLDSYS